MIEDRHHVDDLPKGLLEAVDEDGAGDRGAAELEEVLADPDPAIVRQPQDLLELAGEEALQRIAGRHAVRRGAAPAASGAGSARRSTLPFSVSGRASRKTKAAGSM